MPSEFMEILQNLQKDLNKMTLGTIASSHALSALIESYDGCFYTPEKNKQCAEAWAKALTHLSEAAQEFLDDSARLEAFINGKG